MKKNILLIWVALFNITAVLAQEQKEVAKFYVTHAINNGNDVTEWAIRDKIFTVFYYVGNDLYMANVSERSDTQSWGKVFGGHSENKKETSTEYATDTYYFNWNYTNSYDSKKGTCKVLFTKIYKPQGVVAKLKLITESLDVTEYIGYMEGSIDFSNY